MKKVLELTEVEDRLKRLGYASDSIAYMMGELTRVLNYFNDPTEAAAIISHLFVGAARTRFGEKEFNRFIRDIDPAVVPAHVLEDARFEPLEHWEREQMKPSEIDSFNLERRKFIEKLIARQKRDLQSLPERAELAAQVLCSKHYRALKPSLGLPGPTIREISSPMGGQPGYRVHRKRR